MLTDEQIAPETLRPLRRSDYDRMVELGLFEDERVELLHGMLVAMSPQDALHADVIGRLNRCLVPALLGRALVRVQAPLAVSDESEPEPDVAVVPEGDYSAGHPQTALLVVEVAGSSLKKDRGVKARLYAAAGIPEYWLVDLERRVVEVRTRPTARRYGRLRTKRLGDTITLVELPGVALRIADFLPPDGTTRRRRGSRRR